ncbi:MAG: TlpA disulfide reductase family protein [Chitinophagaceae bacterium]
MIRSIVLFFIGTLLSTFAIAQNKPGWVKLSGNMVHFSNQVNVEDMSEFQYLLPPTNERLFVPEDSSGNFHLRFALGEPNYFRIGRNIVYLSPGDDLQMTIDYMDARNAVFKGRGSQANMYLRFTPFPKAGSFIEAGSNAQPTAKQTIDFIMHAGAERKKQLDSLKMLTPAFRKLETGRIRADIINSLVDGKIPFYRPRAIQHDSLAMQQYAQEYETLVSFLLIPNSKNDFLDASLMKLVVYRDIADELLKGTGKTSEVNKIRDWIKASAIIASMKQVSDKQQLKKMETTIDSITTPEYKAALRKSLAVLLQFGKGDPAIDFTAKDINGNSVLLSSLKGKVIYIDIWATWCGPCMEEMPAFEALKEKYKDYPDLVFVSLSIDNNIPAWEKSLTERKAPGYQWLINRYLLSNYNIVTIPRTLLIDKSFHIVDLNAPLPSSKKLPAMLDALLK